MKKQIPLLAMIAAVMYLGLSNGYLAIFRKGETSPCQVLPYQASLYPASDRLALQKGIPFSTDEELSKLLEDYIG